MAPTFQVLTAFVVGHTLAAYGTQKPEDDSRPIYERLDPTDFAHVREAAGLLPKHEVEMEFEFGLDAMLTGLKTHLRSGRARRSKR